LYGGKFAHQIGHFAAESFSIWLWVARVVEPLELEPLFSKFEISTLDSKLETEIPFDVSFLPLNPSQPAFS
jgi:hypothetical protein